MATILFAVDLFQHAIVEVAHYLVPFRSKQPSRSCSETVAREHRQQDALVPAPFANNDNPRLIWSQLKPYHWMVA
jgi:hypothetical protein